MYYIDRKSMMEECKVVRNHEGFLVNSCSGEVIDFDNYDSTDFSSLEYYEKVSIKKEKRKEINDTKKIVLNYVLSIMNEKEKDEFYRILNEIEKYRKPDAPLYLAIYEHIIAREGKQVKREYLKFLKVRGLGRYAIRQRKKILKKLLREDPVVSYIKNEYEGDKDEALKVYEILKKHNIVHGSFKKRKEILLHYLSNREQLERLLEEEKRKDIENTLLLLNVRDFEGFGLFI